MARALPGIGLQTVPLFSSSSVGICMSRFACPRLPSRQSPPPVPSLQRMNPVQIRVLETLAQANYLELRKVTCEFCGGMLTLRGTVGSYYMKQMAQESLRGLAGVRYIANAIRVSDN